MRDVEPSLVDKVIILDDTLSAHGVPHAFGGALALAYYTLDPRATADIDVNIGVDARVKFHPFASTRLPFLAAVDLAVFKTLFDRPKDWIDIESMRQAGAVGTSPPIRAGPNLTPAT